MDVYGIFIKSSHIQKILTLLPKFCSLESPESHSFVISLQPNIPYVHHNAVVFVTWIPKMMLLEKATLFKNVAIIFGIKFLAV